MQTYAFGSATSDANLVQGYTGASSDVPVPGFTQQLNLFIRSTPEDVSKTLFVVNFQGNDYFFNSTIPPSEVVAKYHSGIERLVKLGAKNILVVRNMNMGLIPYFNTKPETAAYFTSISTKEQLLYKELAAQLYRKYGRPTGRPFRDCKGRKVNIGFLNLWDLFESLYRPSQLKRLGITDVLHGCVSSDYKTVCKTPGKYFFWDDFHPSRKVHNEIAEAVLHLL